MPHVHRLRSASSTIVWSVGFPDNTIEVRTSSARTALERGRAQLGKEASLVAVRVDDPPAAIPGARSTPRRYLTRHDRIRTALLPEARRLRAAGESVTSIAKRLQVKRETLRDWLLVDAA